MSLGSSGADGSQHTHTHTHTHTHIHTHTHTHNMPALVWHRLGVSHERHQRCDGVKEEDAISPTEFYAIKIWSGQCTNCASLPICSVQPARASLFRYRFSGQTPSRSAPIEARFCREPRDPANLPDLLPHRHRQQHNVIMLTMHPSLTWPDSHLNPQPIHLLNPLVVSLPLSFLTHTCILPSLLNTTY
jgi:hypothetical protein